MARLWSENKHISMYVLFITYVLVFTALVRKTKSQIFCPYTFLKIIVLKKTFYKYNIFWKFSQFGAWPRPHQSSSKYVKKYKMLHNMSKYNKICPNISKHIKIWQNQAIKSRCPKSTTYIVTLRTFGWSSWSKNMVTKKPKWKRTITLYVLHT